MNEPLNIADEISIEFADHEVVGLCGGCFTNAIDRHGATEGVQVVADLQLLGHQPALAVDPEPDRASNRDDEKNGPSQLPVARKAF